MHRTLSCLLSCLLLLGCSEDTPQNSDTSAGQDTSRDTSSADTTVGADSTAPDTSGSDTPPEDTSSLPDAVLPPSGGQAAHCASLSETLRAEASGATLLVSPAGPGQVTLDGATMTLRQAVNQASEGDTVVLADGTYTLPEAEAGSYSGLRFSTPNVTLRSQSGDASAVIIDSAYVDHGGSSAAITIEAPGIRLLDFTVQRSIFHLVHFSGGEGDGSVVHNVRMIDGGQQFLKSSSGGDAIDDVWISCSSFEMTPAGRDNVWGYGATDGNTRCYTGGIDTHEATNWVVSDNRFEGIYCNPDGVQRPAHGKKGSDRGDQTYTGGLAEHAIHMWDSVQGTGHVLERNHVINCARGIGIGQVSEVYGTIVRNNFVFSEHAASGEHDVGIILERAHDTQLLNNTVIHTHPQAFASSIEYRWDSTSGVTLANNLTSHQIRSRNAANATLIGNVTDAQSDWFEDASTGALHLASCAVAEVVGQGEPVSDVTDDIDLESRPGTPDVGADQCNQP